MKKIEMTVKQFSDSAYCFFIDLSLTPSETVEFSITEEITNKNLDDFLLYLPRLRCCSQAKKLTLTYNENISTSPLYNSLITLLISFSAHHSIEINLPSSNQNNKPDSALIPLINLCSYGSLFQPLPFPPSKKRERTNIKSTRPKKKASPAGYKTWGDNQRIKPLRGTLNENPLQLVFKAKLPITTIIETIERLKKQEEYLDIFQGIQYVAINEDKDTLTFYLDESKVETLGTAFKEMTIRVCHYLINRRSSALYQSMDSILLTYQSAQPAFTLPEVPTTALAR